MIMKFLQNWKTRTWIIGVLLGAFAGSMAAFIIIQQSEKKNTAPKLNAGQGVQLGLGILGLLRNISDMVSPK